MSFFCWYRENLSGIEVEIYDEIKEGLLSLKNEIKVPRTEYKRISEIYSMVKLDCPEIFYAEAPSYTYKTGSLKITVIPKYLFSDRQIASLRESLSVRLERILKPAWELDEVKAIEFVRNFIFHNVKYEKLEKSYSHEVYGTLSHGIGVCEGIAKTAKLMLDKLGIESVVAIGRENEENFRHAWNMISLYGKMRHFDFTFDLSRIEKGFRPIYSNMTDEMIFKDHNKPVFILPEAF